MQLNSKINGRFIKSIWAGSIDGNERLDPSINNSEILVTSRATI